LFSLSICACIDVKSRLNTVPRSGSSGAKILNYCGHSEQENVAKLTLLATITFTCMLYYSYNREKKNNKYDAK